MASCFGFMGQAPTCAKYPPGGKALASFSPLLASQVRS